MFRISRLHALTVLGYVVRRQPAWLYRLTQHSAMRELVRALRSPEEEDLVVVMSGLLALLALLPVLPAHVAPYLNDLFEVG